MDEIKNDPGTKMRTLLAGDKKTSPVYHLAEEAGSAPQ